MDVDKFKSAVIVGTALALSLTALETAHAAMIAPPIISDAYYRANSRHVPGPGTYTDLFGWPGDIYTVILAATPTPSIRAHMSIGHSSSPSLDSSIDYSYHISGPATSSGTVAAHVTTNMWATQSPSVAGGGGDITASLYLTLDTGQQQIAAVCESIHVVVCSSFSNHGPAFSGTLIGQLAIDGLIRLDTHLEAGDASMDVFVDPLITVPIGYTIAFSAGIGNDAPSAVPEPSSLALTFIGLLGLGVTRRRARLV